MNRKKAAAKTEGEGECFAAGPLRAGGHIQQIQPLFAGLVPHAERKFSGSADFREIILAMYSFAHIDRASNVRAAGRAL